MANIEQQSIPEKEEKSLTIKTAVREQQFWIAFFVFFCLGYINFAVFVHIVPHTTDLGIDPAAAAGIMSIMGGSSGLGGFLFSILADKIGNKKVFVIAFSVLFLSLVFLLFASDLARLRIFAVLFSFALGGCCMTQSPMVASIFGLRSHGLVFGALNFGFAIGATLGSLFTGFVYDTNGTYQVAFIVIVVLAFIGAV